MQDDFYPFVDSGEPVPDNSHITGVASPSDGDSASGEQASYATRIAIYDDMLSTPRVVVIAPKDVRSYLEEITNTVYRCMKEQGGTISLMVIREIVENFIHAHFVEPIISILDGGQTIRFADQGPGIEDKERAFEFGVTSADRSKKRYIRGTGAGFPMVKEYLENAGGAVSIEDNLGQGTVITVSLDPARVEEIERAAARGAAVRGGGYGQRMQAAPVPGPQGFPAAQQQAVEQPLYSEQQPYGGYNPYGGQAPLGAGYPNPAMQPAAPGMQGAWGQPAPGMGQGYGYQQPYGYPAYPQQGYPQPAHQFSTYPQQGYPPAGTPIPMPVPQPAAQAPYVSERGRLALSYLVEHEFCGPTDLAGAFGSSNATWSRELDTLTTSGFVIKRGQKRMLTDMGRMWLQEQQH